MYFISCEFTVSFLSFGLLIDVSFFQFDKSFVQTSSFNSRESDDRIRTDAAASSEDQETDIEARILRQFTEERIHTFHTLARKPDLYERLTAAIAPTIYENEDVKKGILLQV